MQHRHLPVRAQRSELDRAIRGAAGIVVLVLVLGTVYVLLGALAHAASAAITGAL